MQVNNSYSIYKGTLHPYGWISKELKQGCIRDPLESGEHQPLTTTLLPLKPPHLRRPWKKKSPSHIRYFSKMEFEQRPYLLILF